MKVNEAPPRSRILPRGVPRHHVLLTLPRARKFRHSRRLDPDGSAADFRSPSLRSSIFLLLLNEQLDKSVSLSRDGLDSTPLQATFQLATGSSFIT